MAQATHRPCVIFQIGAHAGDDDLIERCRSKGCQMYMFEPNPKRFEELKRKIQGIANIQVFPLAVSNRAGRAMFNIANFDDCSSLQDFGDRVNETWLNKWHPYKHFEMLEQVEVEVVRLDTFLEQHNLEVIDFIEIDTQGEDLRVVESLGDKIAQVKKIQIEVNVHSSPLYKNAFTREEAIEYFTKFQFERHVSWKQSVNREENIIFRNSRFYPNPVYNFFTAKGEESVRRFSYSMVKFRRVMQFVWSKIKGN